VARLGGDEFVVLLEMSGVDRRQAQEQAEAVATKIRAALSEEYVLGGIRHHASASVGIKLVDEGDEDPDQILKDADAAMYEAKRPRGTG
jgi:diguanylate cyclase (GGDEF)-like protein